MAFYKFLRGLSSALPKVAEDGVFYLTTDTHQLFVGQGTDMCPVNEGVVTVEGVEQLPETAITGSFYYATTENVLCVYNGQGFVQINPDSGATNFVAEGEGNVITGMTYDEKTRTVTYTKGTVDLDAVKNDVYQVTSDSLDIDVLAKDITPKAGDVLVVTSTVNNIKSAYSYDAEDGWIACDGNVSADKVILKDNITLAGNYTTVGNITKANNSATGTFKTAGKSVATALTEIFSKRLQPGNPTQPSVSFTTNITKEVEVGTSVTPSYAVKLNAGSYTYGPATGITAKTWSITDSKNNTALTTASGSFPEFVVGDNESYTITATATYDAGAVAKDNLGEESNPKKQIAAGEKSATSGTITGYRKMFYGCKTTLDTDLNSDDIRALNGAKAAKGTFSMDVPEGTVQVIIAVPSSYTLSAVADTKAYGTDIVASFNDSSLNVEGASDYKAIGYTVYQYTPATALGANTYDVTIG